MHRTNALISLADLSAAGVRLRPYEAVTLVRELVLQVTRGEIPGVPSAHVIRLSAPGSVSVEGPVAAGGGSVARAAQLLEALLPDGDLGNQFRIPGGLKLVVARALGHLDLPPFPSLEAFAESLSRFAATDAAATITNIIATWNECVATRTSASQAVTLVEASAQAQVEPFVAPRAQELLQRSAGDALTISDIRRARRATGLTLAEVSRRSRISVSLLRQLEWGYLPNWPDGHYGRSQLIRYARGAGLDEQLVVSTVLPLLREAERKRQALVPQPIVPLPLARVEPPIDVEVTRVPEPDVVPERAASRRSRLLAALAVPALLAIGLLPVLWIQSSRTDRAAVSGSNAAVPSAPVEAAHANEPRRDMLATSDSVRSAPTASEDDAAPPAVDAATRRIAHRADDADAAAPAGAAYRLAADGVTYSPSFSSVGTAMFYHADENGKAALMRADTDSRGAVLQITRIVDDSAKNFHVRPSPDGSRIAFDSNRDGERGVYVADADGKNVRRVSPEGFAAVPSWSPDGQRLAFVRAEASRPHVWNLWTLDLGSGDLQQITRHRFGQPWGGSWFPDNRRLAYSHEDRLVVRDLDSGTERVFRSPIRGRLMRTPAVSPDGQRIVFQVYRDGTWLLELSNASMRRILEDPTAEEYTWSPDGKRVAYHSRKSGQWGLWVMAPR